MSNQRLEVHFECPECDNKFSELYVEDYFEDEDELEEELVNMEAECPICGCEECIPYRYNFVTL